MDQELNMMVQGCTRCQEMRGETPKVPLEPWRWPSRPWTRIHLDYAGPFMNHMFLIIVDAHSKWVEIFKTKSSSTFTTIDCLRQTFARYGIPTTIVSDNGPCFSSQEFENFIQSNGISHVKTAPYHPQSNGLAEKMVQTFKNSMKKQPEESIDVKLARFLLTYRSTPHSSTNKTPAELFFGRQVRTVLDLLHPNLRDSVVQKQTKQKHYFDRTTKDKVFTTGDPVYVRNFSRQSPSPAWIPGVVHKQVGESTFVVRLVDSSIYVKRHKRQVKPRIECIPQFEVGGNIKP